MPPTRVPASLDLSSEELGDRSGVYSIDAYRTRHIITVKPARTTKRDARGINKML